jgi:serine/threonine protein kinase
VQRVSELVGETVDTRYELRRLIAHGGMGLVFEAHHKLTRRTVALKLLPKEVRAHKEARGRLLREAHALTTVRCPGFVEVLDAGVCAEHGPYVVMEMLDGRTLGGILAARQRLPVADTVQIGRQVCDALAHAHTRGVIHRDLKPSNIFVARNEIGDETVKIIDLGVAAVGEEQLAQLDRKLTTAHEVLGTPEYMAPEQLWGREVDARTDVYALAMSLYECLTGDVPYTGSYPEVLVQVSNAAGPPAVRDRRADVEPTLATVIEHALEKEAGARFQSMQELGRALLAASGLAPGPSALLAVSDDPSPPSGDRPSGELPSGQLPADQPEEERAIRLVRKKTRRPGSPPGVPEPVPGRRRQHVRVPYVTPVLLMSATGSAIEARSEEISEDGMLLLTPLAFPLGAPLKLQFASPTTGEMITTDGAVRWLREARGRSAMGVEFLDMPAVLRRVVADYVAMLQGAH